MSMKWKETEETSYILTVVKLLNIINDNYFSNTGHCLFSLVFSSQPHNKTNQRNFYTPGNTGIRLKSYCVHTWNQYMSLSQKILPS